MTSEPRAIEEHVMGASVFDTHTHLDESQSVPAASVWDILHYFWFERELCAAGYPADARQLSEADRREAFLAAFERSRNTYWNTIVRRMVDDLFHCRLETSRDLDVLAEKIESTSADPEWPTTVCDRIRVKNIVVGTGEMDVAPSLAERLVVVPYFEIAGILNDLGGGDPAEADGAWDAVRSELGKLLDAGFRTIRVDLEPLVSGRLAADAPTGAEDELYHSMLAELDRAGTRIQVFTGMRRDWKHSTMLNDPQRIVRLYPVFDRYSNAQFEFVNAAAGNDFDILQAARVFPNVQPGGLWWFNFRASSYASMMQQRFEALPASRSCIVASDARCIEWQYAKVLFIKIVLARFLQEQIDRGWTDLEGAKRAADEWLFESARSGYLR
ncbi:MAG: hypothetical protein ACOCZB_04840 [Spirochaetota bacterium]